MIANIQAKNYFFILFALTLCGLGITRLDITNIKCTAVDPNFCQFEYCYIKAVNRTYRYISLKAKLLKVPVNNVVIRGTLMKKTNNFKPYLYDITFDACKQLRERKNPMLNFAYGFVEKYSNMNHTCPYDHDIVLEKLDTNFIRDHFLKWLPLPVGEYAAFTTWFAYNTTKAYVKVFGNVF